MRPHFSYDPGTDLLIPCKDAGLSFKAGDILEILNTDDAFTDVDQADIKCASSNNLLNPTKKHHK